MRARPDARAYQTWQGMRPGAWQRCNGVTRITQISYRLSAKYVFHYRPPLHYPTPYQGYLPVTPVITPLTPCRIRASVVTPLPATDPLQARYIDSLNVISLFIIRYG